MVNINSVNEASLLNLMQNVQGKEKIEVDNKSKQIECGEEKLSKAMDALSCNNSALVKRGHLVEKEYNENGTIKSKTTPFSHKEYDEFGDLKSKTLPNGTKIEYFKNGVQRSVKHSDGYKETYTDKGYIETKEYSDGSKQIYGRFRGISYVQKEILADGAEKLYYENGELFKEYTAEEAKAKREEEIAEIKRIYPDESTQKLEMELLGLKEE